MKTRRGFTMMETAMTILLVMMAVFLVFNVGLQASRLASKVDSRNSVLLKAREGYELLSRDIKLADAVLAQYPPNGVPTHRTSTNNSIILRIPRADANGDVIPNSWTVVMYRINPPNGAPMTGADYTNEYDLERWTAEITPNITPALTRDRVVGKGICQLRFAFQGIDSFEGDGNRTEYNLEAMPIGNGSGITQEVLVNGVNWLGTMAAIRSDVVEFNWRPKSGVLIDINYRIDPAVVSAPFGATGADLVHVTVRGRAKWRNRQEQQKENLIEFSSRVRLMNRT